MKIKEVIVVEGKDDTIRIKQAVQADTIETNGSAVSEETLRKIERANEKRGVIIFTDPDYPGQRIRTIISKRIPGCKHAFLSRTEAKGKENESLGIEHASNEAIQEALAAVKTEYKEPPGEAIAYQDLIDAGLIAGNGARKRREKLGILLRIGYCNGKQLYHRLTIFHVTEEEFRDAMEQVLQEENNE